MIKTNSKFSKIDRDFQNYNLDDNISIISKASFESVKCNFNSLTSSGEKENQ